MGRILRVQVCSALEVAIAPTAQNLLTSIPVLQELTPPRLASKKQPTVLLAPKDSTANSWVKLRS